MRSILIAGIGNIFNGDDAFGVEVAHRLMQRPLPPEVKVIDFGIRGIDLTYALLDGYGAAVLVDSAKRGECPGTISIVDLSEAASEPAPADDFMLSPHELDPAKVLRSVAALGGSCDEIFLVGCEPLTFGGEEGLMGLSAPVAAALDIAVRTVEELADQLIKRERGRVKESTARVEME